MCLRLKYQSNFRFRNVESVAFNLDLAQGVFSFAHCSSSKGMIVDNEAAELQKLASDADHDVPRKSDSSQLPANLAAAPRYYALALTSPRPEKIV